jgi:hypothetical protein
MKLTSGNNPILAAGRRCVGGLRRHPGPSALILALIAFFWRALFAGQVFYLKDALLWFYPSKYLWREQVLGGHLPLWAPELGLGAPLLANPGHGALYPLDALLLLPWPYCVTLFLVVHVWLAALGTYALLRTLGATAASAVTGALAFGLGGYVLSMTWSGTYLVAIAWMPLVVALGLRAGRGRDPASIGVLGLALGTQMLSGELQGVGLTLFLLAAFALADAGRSWGSLIRIGLGALLAAIVAMIQILPALHLLPLTDRAAGLDYSEAARWSLHPARLLELFVEGLYGHLAPREEFIGFSLVNSGRDLRALPWMVTPYCGSIAVLLAALSFRGARSPRWLWPAAAVTLVALLLALGSHTPLFEPFFRFAPAGRFFRYPEKFFAAAAFGIALLAGAGAGRVAEAGASTPRRLFLLWGVSAALCLGATAFAPAAAALVAARDPSVTAEAATEIVRGALLFEGGALLGLGLVVYLVWRNRPRWLPAAIASALLVQLAIHNRDVAPTMSPRIYKERSALAEQIVAGTPPGEPVRLYHDSIKPPVWSGCTSSRNREEISTVIAWSLAMNTGVIHGVGYPQAYDAFAPETENRFWNETAGARRRVLDLLAVRHFVLPPWVPVAPTGGATRLHGFERSCLAPYRSSTTLPIARPVARALPAASWDDALRMVASAEVLSGDAAVVEGLATPEDRGGQPPPLDGAIGSCRSARPVADRFSTTCALEAPAWVVIGISHYPGWEAAIDGTAAPVHRANAIAMAVRAPAGRHRVDLRYRQPGLLPGALLTGLGSGLSLLLIVIGRRRRSGE